MPHLPLHHPWQVCSVSWGRGSVWTCTLSTSVHSVEETPWICFCVGNLQQYQLQVPVSWTHLQPRKPRTVLVVKVCSKIMMNIAYPKPIIHPLWDTAFVSKCQIHVWNIAMSVIFSHMQASLLKLGANLELSEKCLRTEHYRRLAYLKKLLPCIL